MLLHTLYICRAIWASWPRSGSYCRLAAGLPGPTTSFFVGSLHSLSLIRPDENWDPPPDCPIRPNILRDWAGKDVNLSGFLRKSYGPILGRLRPRLAPLL
jgi:hypothetical protein